MLWIKRNLFLAVGGFVAVLLLAGGAFYFISAQQRNKAIEEQLEANKAELNRLQGQSPFPSAKNIEIAKVEADKLRKAVGDLHRFFAPVPVEKVTGSIELRRSLDRTLAEIQQMAAGTKTTLPSTAYAFSFETQKPKTSFQEGTFPAIPEQLAEVKALCRILFDAHVNPLYNVRRARVSRDDEQSSSLSDYINLKVETNAVTRTVTSPYEVTFGGLSAEVAAVLDGLAASPHGFIVKSVHVEPGVEQATNAVMALPAGGAVNSNPPGRPPRPGTPAAAAAANKPVAGEKPVFLLREKRLKVTLSIHAIKAVK
jgi:hypothetical protein